MSLQILAVLISCVVYELLYTCSCAELMQQAVEGTICHVLYSCSLSLSRSLARHTHYI